MAPEEVNDRVVSSRPRFFSVYAVALYGLWSVIILHVIVASLPFSAIHLRIADSIDFRLLMPEGWAFFTRNPREPRMTLYQRNGRAKWTPVSHSQSSPAILLGLRRTARAQGMEAGLLIENLSDDKWRRCEKLKPVDCIARGGAIVQSRINRSASPTLCGEIAVVMQEPLPWAWLGSRNSINMPSRFVRLRVAC